MVSCFILGCKTGNGTRAARKAKQPSKFHPPMKNAALLKKWRDSIPRSDKVLSANDIVCELHFPPEMIIRHFTHVIDGKKVLLERKIIRLRPDAVPSIFPAPPPGSSASPHRRSHLSPIKRSADSSNSLDCDHSYGAPAPQSVAFGQQPVITIRTEQSMLGMSWDLHSESVDELYSNEIRTDQRMSPRKDGFTPLSPIRPPLSTKATNVKSAANRLFTEAMASTSESPTIMAPTLLAADISELSLKITMPSQLWGSHSNSSKSFVAFSHLAEDSSGAAASTDKVVFFSDLGSPANRADVFLSGKKVDVVGSLVESAADLEKLLRKVDITFACEGIFVNGKKLYDRKCEGAVEFGRACFNCTRLRIRSTQDVFLSNRVVCKTVILPRRD